MEIFEAFSDGSAIYDAIEGFPTLRRAAATLADVIHDGIPTRHQFVDMARGYGELRASHRLGSHVHDSAQSPARKRSRADDMDDDDVVKRLSYPIAHSIRGRLGVTTGIWTPIVTC